MKIGAFQFPSLLSLVFFAESGDAIGDKYVSQMCASKITEQDLIKRGFAKESHKTNPSAKGKTVTTWTKPMDEGTVILVEDGEDLYLPKFEPQGRDEQKFYDKFHSSGIPSEKITNLEELDEYIDAIQKSYNADTQS